MTITQVVVSPNIVIRDLGSQLGYEVFVHRQARKFHDLFTNLGVRRRPMPTYLGEDWESRNGSH